MTTVALDPLIHHPGRLRVVATLAALPGGDALTVTRLQKMIRHQHPTCALAIPTGTPQPRP